MIVAMHQPNLYLKEYLIYFISSYEYNSVKNMYIQQQIFMYMAQLMNLINRYEDSIDNNNLKMILELFEQLHVIACNTCPDKKALKYEIWHKSLIRNINISNLLEIREIKLLE